MKLSIIIISKKIDSGLMNTIDNWLYQDYKDKEIIVVAPDKKKINKNVKQINDLKKGPSAARNLGLKYAKGEYVMIMDSDPFSVKKDDIHLISYAMEKIINEKATTAHFNFYPLKTGNFLRNMINIKDTYTIKNPEHIWPVIIKKSLIKKGFDEYLEFGEDKDFFLNINKVSTKKVFIEKEFMNDSSIDNFDIFFKRYKWYGSTISKYMKKTKDYFLLFNLFTSVLFVITLIVSIKIPLFLFYNLLYFFYYYAKRIKLISYILKKNMIFEFLAYPIITTLSQLIICYYMVKKLLIK